MVPSDYLYFGETNLGLYFVVSDISKPMLPSRRFLTKARAGIGDWMNPYGLDSMEIKVKVSLREHDPLTISERIRLIASILYADELQELRLPNEPDKHYLVYYEGGNELDRLYRWPSTTLTFKAPDPIAYGRTKTATATLAAGGTMKVTNRGTAETAPVITLNPRTSKTVVGKTATLTLTNVNSGEFISVAYTTNSTQYEIVLDCQNERCLLSGNDHAVSLGSTFFKLPVGETELSLAFAYSGTFDSGKTTVEWQERWL